MRTHARIWFFCAVALLVCPCAGPSVGPSVGWAAEGGAEYRAPVSGLKLTPPQARTDTVGQPAPSSENAAPSQPRPQFSGMTTYSAVQAQPGRADSPTGSFPSSPANSPADTPAGSPAGAPGAGETRGPAAASSQPAAAQAPQTPLQRMPPTMPPTMPQAGQALESAPQNAVPYSSMPASAGRNGDVVSGTSQLEGGDSEESGYVRQYRDPETGDIITSVVPPKQPQQDYGTFFIAPQIYPGRHRPPNSGWPSPGGSAWPGQQTAPPAVIWVPGGQTAPPHRHERPRKERRPADAGYGNPGYGPGRAAPHGRNDGGEGYGQGGYPHAAPAERRDADRSGDDGRRWP